MLVVGLGEWSSYLVPSGSTSSWKAHLPSLGTLGYRRSTSVTVACVYLSELICSYVT